MTANPVDWTVIITAILTATVTLLGVYFANKHNRHSLLLQLEDQSTRERKHLLRERLEEIFLLSEKYVNLIFNRFNIYTSVMKGKISYNEALDLEVEDSGKRPDFLRLEMLVDIYYPCLKIMLTMVQDRRDAGNAIINEFRKKYEGGGDFHESLDAISKTITALNTDGIAFRNAIIMQARSMGIESIDIEDKESFWNRGKTKAV